MVKWVTLDSRTLLKPYTSNIYEMEEDEPNEVNKIQRTPITAHTILRA